MAAIALPFCYTGKLKIHKFLLLNFHFFLLTKDIVEYTGMFRNLTSPMNLIREIKPGVTMFNLVLLSKQIFSDKYVI